MKDQLRKEYIRLSKSPQTSLVVFVGKKDRSKQMVIDYYNLNDQTVKNNYLLLLITITNGHLLFVMGALIL